MVVFEKGEHYYVALGGGSKKKRAPLTFEFGISLNCDQLNASSLCHHQILMTKTHCGVTFCSNLQSEHIVSFKVIFHSSLD